ncbi:MAG: 4Fe-4S binding protein [Syntrophobacterales bacterium]|jgi:NAD-dependent dihydropyrimidine dehydrogenase PreA subunit|nr:4Fe-4S binding protein [Syntrophobacterales bacterium]
MRPYISQELCKKCLECVEICPYEVFVFQDEDVVAANSEDCIECASCVDMCPDNAIRMDD